jgi:hypothetical protein
VTRHADDKEIAVRSHERRDLTVPQLGQKNPRHSRSHGILIACEGELAAPIIANSGYMTYLALAIVMPSKCIATTPGFTGRRHPADGQERSQITRLKKMEPRKYIHAAITNRINPRNPPVKNFSLALTTNGILSGRCSILALCLLGGIKS